jgi:epoxyqueuosine reductase
MTSHIGFEALAQEGCKIRVVSTQHLDDLRREIETRRSQRQFDPEFAKGYLFRFKLTLPDELKDAKALVVVAMPRPPKRAIFNWKGKKQVFILPPTYTAYDEKRLHVERLVAEAVEKEDFKVATPSLPLKLLAACCGLAEYGRNNIAYVEGMGSFMRLTAVYTDMPPDGNPWQEPQMMKRCQNCELCQNACPTGAIAKDRFLLHAERCLTYHNEKDGEVPFPSWIEPQWHNCVVGCIKCQAACPANRPFLGRFGETAEFDQQETMLLLKGTSKEQIPQATLQKMQALSLTDYFNHMPRNLSVLLK